MSFVICHLSFVICHLSVVSCQLSVVSCQLSVAICYLSWAIAFAVVVVVVVVAVVDLACLVTMRMSAIDHALHREQAHIRHLRLQRWRDRLRTGLPAVAKWINARLRLPTPALQDSHGLAQSPAEATKKIAHHWATVWGRFEAHEHQTRLDRACALFAETMEQIGYQYDPSLWTTPTAEEYHAAMRASHGSGSTDG